MAVFKVGKGAKDATDAALTWRLGCAGAQGDHESDCHILEDHEFHAS